MTRQGLEAWDTYEEAFDHAREANRPLRGYIREHGRNRVTVFPSGSIAPHCDHEGPSANPCREGLDDDDGPNGLGSFLS